MDSIKIEKINAIKMYKRNQLLKNLFLYSFIALACLFYSSPFWFPYIASSMEVLLLVHVPKLSSLLFNSKFVFIVGNIIIVALIGESKIFPSNSASPNNITHHQSYYDEYITTKQTLQKFSAPNDNNKEYHQKKERLCIVETKRGCENIVEEEKDDLKIVGKVEKRVLGLGVVVKKLEGFGGKENHDRSLPNEELKKRSDDFIARVNKRRVFEARELLCDV